MNGENLGIRGLSTDYIESFPSAVYFFQENLLPNLFFSNIKFFLTTETTKEDPPTNLKEINTPQRTLQSTCPKTNVENQ